MSAWYPKLRKNCIKCTVVPLSVDFIEFLESDGMALPTAPPDAHPLDPRVFQPRRPATPTADDSSSAASKDEDSEEDDESAVVSPRVYSFPELETAISDAIAESGGSVFARLDWTAPLDAVWMMETGTMKCETAGDVFKLCKASDLIQYDVDLHKRRVEAGRGGDSTTALHLCLRPWYNFHRANEFRVFVRGSSLVGISQRHTTEYFPTLARAAGGVKSLICNFFEEVLRDKFTLDTCK